MRVRLYENITGVQLMFIIEEFAKFQFSSLGLEKNNTNHFPTQVCKSPEFQSPGVKDPDGCCPDPGRTRSGSP